VFYAEQLNENHGQPKRGNGVDDQTGKIQNPNAEENDGRIKC
jgi:hypothetical protein